MQTNKLEASVINILNQYYQKYLTRKNKLNKPKKLDPSQVVGLLCSFSGAGAALGSPLPVIGTAIGAAVGLGVGGIVTGAIAISYKLKNDKLKKAQSALDAINATGLSQDKLFFLLAKQSVNDANLELVNDDDEKNTALLAKKFAKDSIENLKILAKENRLVANVSDDEAQRVNQKKVLCNQGIFQSTCQKPVELTVSVSKKYGCK